MKAAIRQQMIDIHNHNRKIIFWKQRWVALGLVCLLFGVMCLFTSCDEHEPIDNDIHTGYILCDDHSVMSLEAFKEVSHLAPVGVIFSAGSTEHPDLAVMLFENDGIQYTNKIPLECNTSGDVTGLDGYVNSVGMFNTYEEEEFNDTVPDRESSDPDAFKIVKRKEYYFSPLGQWVFASHEYGQSDYIPSYSEARLLQQNVHHVNSIIRELVKLGFEAQEIATSGDCWYWTSTEDADDDANRAWLCSMGSPGFQQTPKFEPHKARAIVALNY